VPRGSAIESSLVDRLREVLAVQPPELCSVSSLGELLVVRALGESVQGVRTRLIEAWQVLRPALLERPAVLPRVWAT
jgi:urease accessory protein